MNCPYCGKEMELGSIQSKKALCWYPGEKRRIVGPAKYFEGAVTLSDFHITGSAMKPKAELNSSRPKITPIIPIGAVSIITSSLRISCICSIIRTTISSSISGIGFIR